GGRGCLDDHWHWDLELHDEHVAWPETFNGSRGVGGVEPRVGARRDGDHVLAVRADKDQCGAGRGCVIRLDTGRVHAVGSEILDESWTKIIAAHTTHQGDLATEASRSDRLVCALATRVAAEPLAENRLAGPGQAWHRQNEIDVQAAQHKNSGQRFDWRQGLRLSVGLAVGGWGYRAPHGTGDDNDGQQIRQHAKKLKRDVHAGNLDAATERLGAREQ